MTYKQALNKCSKGANFYQVPIKLWLDENNYVWEIATHYHYDSTIYEA